MNNNKSLKILLVQPSVEDFYFTPHRSSSLGLFTLAASWGSRGHSCQVINCTMEKPLKKHIELPSCLNYLKPYLLKQNTEMKDTSWFTKYYRFGSSYEICIGKILNFNPDVIAVSCFAWSYSESSIQLLQKLQDLRRNTTNSSFLLVTGGPGVTVMPGYFTPFADLVVTGEGEDAIVTIEKMASKSLQKINYPLSSKILNPGYSGELPFVYNIRSRRNSRFTVSTIISRGCPKKCSFCANHLVFGRALRKVPFVILQKGMDSLIEDIKAKNNKKQQEKLKLHINFEDDNILFYKEYFLEVLKYINEICQNNEIDFTFTTENGMDYILLNKNILDEFKALNIAQLNLSMASMDSEQLKSSKRSGNLTKLESIILYSSKLNIPSITYFICGLNGDTANTIVQTINYLHSLKTSIGISNYYPVPGLDDWLNKDIFLKNPQALCRGSSSYPWNNRLSTKELITAFRLARTSNFIKLSKADKNKIENLNNNLLKDSTMEKGMVLSFFDQLLS